MNNLVIVGRIGRVGDLKYTQSGKAATYFSVAVDNGKTSDGEKREATWFEVTLWEKQAESLHQYLKVGDRIGVSGQVQLKAAEERGEKTYPAKLTVSFPRIELLGDSNKKNDTQNAKPAQRQAAPAAAVDDHGDIEF